MPDSASIGIAVGLSAAAVQSASYIFSRRFTLPPQRSALRLLAVSHLWMGLLSAVLLIPLWDPTLRQWDRYLVPATGASGFYLVGQVALFVALRRSDASRISPLLGLKVIVVALFAVAWQQDGYLTPWQWGAVGLSGAAAFALNYTGGSLPARTVFAMAVTVTMYALSDLYIVKLIDVFGPRQFINSARAACVCYLLCGAAGAMMLPWTTHGDRTDWSAALPFTLTWFASMFLFFWCLALSGVVMGNIVLSTRGMFSIGLGMLLAWRGHEHLERKASVGIHARRILAAGAMIGAIAIYYSAVSPP